MTPEIEALYQSIGAEIRSIPPEPFQTVVLYAEVEDGVIGNSVFYARSLADNLVYRPGSDRLDMLVYDLWERWQSVSGHNAWRALLYEINGDKFRVDVTYADTFNESLSEIERRSNAIEAIFGKRKIDYPKPGH